MRYKQLTTIFYNHADVNIDKADKKRLNFIFIYIGFFNVI